MGEDPERVQPETLEGKVATVRESRRLRLLGEHEVVFDPAEQIIYRSDEVLPFHANALRVRLNTGGDGWREATYYSVGGGFVVQEGEEPGGALHPREHIADAVRREVLEETGIPTRQDFVRVRLDDNQQLRNPPFVIMNGEGSFTLTAEERTNLVPLDEVPRDGEAAVLEREGLLAEAREAAFSIVERDPPLRADEHERLRARYEAMYADEGLGFARVG